MRDVVLNHISSIDCVNPLGQTPMLDSTKMSENWNFGFPYSFLPRFPLPRFQSSRLSVCPSITRILCDETKENTAKISILHENIITLVF